MANLSASKKAIRQIARRTKINKDRLARIRTYVKKVEKSIAQGDKTGAQEALKAAESQLHRGVHKGLFHPNMVARKVSRLSRSIKTLSA
jgi:small subunit ribosomal protein S20